MKKERPMLLWLLKEYFFSCLSTAFLLLSNLFPLQARVTSIAPSITINRVQVKNNKITIQAKNEKLSVSSVVVDDYVGAFEATKHLIQQGCHRIAHIGGQQHVSIFNQRLKGYINALNVHGIPVNEDLIVYGKVSIESGRDCMMKLLAGLILPDAVFAVEDFTALGAVQAIKAAHKKIPEDIAIIGFANEAFGEYLTPSLSTINQQTVRMGEEAANLFFREQQKTDLLHEPHKLILNPELIVRQSSMKYP